VTEQAGVWDAYVPQMAVEWVARSPGSNWQSVEGSLVFVDISGFTNLSERLASRGRIGAEELTGVLNRVFARMLEIAYVRGGYLLKFGGDAEAKPMPATILYVVAFPLGQEPAEFATPRTGGLKL